MKKWITPSLVIALVGLVTVVFQYLENPTNSADHASVINGAIIQGSPGTNVHIEKTADLLLPIPLTATTKNVKRVSDNMQYSKMYNTKFLLPNNEVAYATEISKDVSIIAYTNTDCSEVHVTKRFSNPIPDDEICWIESYDCKQGQISDGPKAIRDMASCYQE